MAEKIEQTENTKSTTSKKSERKASQHNQQTTDGYDSRVVEIRRTTKVREGGRDFSFSALAVVGDGNGRIGYGRGKGKKSWLQFKKQMMQHAEIWLKSLYAEILYNIRLLDEKAQRGSLFCRALMVQGLLQAVQCVHFLKY